MGARLRFIKASIVTYLKQLFLSLPLCPLANPRMIALIAETNSAT